MIEPAFVQNILEQPDDDAVRLIYADWLLERGDPASAARGEFIQTQVLLARSEGLLADWDEWAELAGRLPQLRTREKALLDQYGAEWARPLSGLVRGYSFRRGFVESVVLPASTFIDRGAELFRSQPVQDVRFFSVDRAMVQLAACSHLARLRTIDLSGVYFAGNAGFRALLSSHHLGRLRVLRVAHSYLGDDGLRALAESPLLRQLHHLDLSRTSVTLEGVRALLRSPHWGGLRSLMLTNIPNIHESDFEALSASLEGRPEGSSLETVLRLLVSPRSVFRNAHARRLAQQAVGDPTHTAATLAHGLAVSHRRVRAAATQMLARLGLRALPTLPALVRRLYERRSDGRDSVVFDCAASTLLDLLPALPAEMRGWLGLLANPLRLPETNLRLTLENSRLPRTVWEAFAALCVRRLVWHARIRGETDTPPATPIYPDSAALWELIQRIVERPHSDRHHKEAAWLLARLCELLLHHQEQATP